MQTLVAVDTVHTAASACDYLAARCSPDESIHAVAVDDGSPDAATDGREALNVLRVRLPEHGPTTELRTGDPVEELLAACEEHAVDQLVVGRHAGRPGASGLGSTARELVERAPRHVVVLAGVSP